MSGAYSKDEEFFPNTIVRGFISVVVMGAAPRNILYDMWGDINERFRTLLIAALRIPLARLLFLPPHAPPTSPHRLMKLITRCP
jgi:hypothetical protein